MPQVRDDHLVEDFSSGIFQSWGEWMRPFSENKDSNDKEFIIWAFCLKWRMSESWNHLVIVNYKKSTED